MPELKQIIVKKQVRMNMMGQFSGIYLMVAPALPGCATAGIYPPMFSMLMFGTNEWRSLEEDEPLITDPEDDRYVPLVPHDLDRYIRDLLLRFTKNKELGITEDTDLTLVPDDYYPLSNLYRTVECDVYITAPTE